MQTQEAAEKDAAVAQGVSLSRSRSLQTTKSAHDNVCLSFLCRFELNWIHFLISNHIQNFTTRHLWLLATPLKRRLRLSWTSHNIVTRSSTATSKETQLKNIVIYDTVISVCTLFLAVKHPQLSHIGPKQRSFLFIVISTHGVCFYGSPVFNLNYVLTWY